MHGDDPDRPAASAGQAPAARGPAAPGEEIASAGALAGLVESLIEYLAARLRLEGYRAGALVEGMVKRLLALSVAVGVILIGLLIASLGIALAISEWIGWRPAGPLIVGAGYALIGGIIGYAATRRSKGSP